MKEVILTGIKPTGIAHIGNYLGAIKPAISMKSDENTDAYIFIADLHALNKIDSAQELKDNCLNIASTWLACGLDPDKFVFYKQSLVPETCELYSILTNVTAKGLMNRAHAYKAMVANNLERNQDADDGVNMGLYNYPILMAADILLFNTKKVPIGQDQKQHVEIARDIAKTFNKKYGYTLVVPNDVITEGVGTIEGLDGRKMSKSYGNTIPLFAKPEQLKKLISSIKTDSSLPTEPKSTDCTIFNLYKHFATPEQIENLRKKFEKGIGWAEAKSELFEVMNNYLTPMREKYEYYISHPEVVNKYLEDGAKKARVVAKETIERVKKAVGLID